MADEDFNLMISSSAAASSTMPSASLPTTDPTVLQRAYESDPDDDFDVAYMVVKVVESTSASTTTPPITEGEQLFPTTAVRLLRGRTWMSATLENPEYFFAAYESKKNPKYLTAYIEWVKQHFVIDTQAKRLTRRVAQQSTPAAVIPPPFACSHAKTTRRGSGARFLSNQLC